MKTKKELDDEKKKLEEQAAAQAYQDFVSTFEDVPAQKGKVWVKAGTFDAGSRREDTKDKGKLYKPTSRLAELAEKFSTPEQASGHRGSERPERPSKKKEKEKKKSNLELFKEELKMIQEERAERHRIKTSYNIPSSREPSTRTSRFDNAENLPPIKPLIIAPYGNDEKGSYDGGDPTTTNLYLGNLCPKITEQRLMELFGRFGPLASIKIMWPRTDDERNRGRNCGFVAYMNRRDGERALANLNGRDIDGFEMKLGWGKAVPIPSHPIYIPPSLVEMTLPPPPSGLPFNAQPDNRDKDKLPVGCPPMELLHNQEFTKILQRAIVKVVIPTERTLLQMIHRTIEFVIREGPMFEAMIMNRELNNPAFRFLFENQSPAHVYYRWKMYSILQGEPQNRWSTKPFKMFTGGSIWKPPPVNPFLQGMPEELVDTTEHIEEDQEKAKRGSLSITQRSRLEVLIRNLTPEREKIGECMTWCIEHADSAEEICQCLTEALTNPDTALYKKIARLYLISDILHNCSVKVSNASFFRKGFQSKLAEIFDGLHVSYTCAESRIRAENLKQRVMTCFQVWEDWAIYSHEFLIHCQNIFLGLVKRMPNETLAALAVEEEKEMKKKESSEDVDGIPIEDVDGFPLNETKEGNLPVIVKSDAISALLGYADDDDEDLDGAPIDEDLDGEPISGMNKIAPGFVPSKWESVDPNKLIEQAVTVSKWDLLENRENAENNSDSDDTPIYGESNVSKIVKASVVDDLDGIPIMYDDYKRSRDSSEDEENSNEEDNSEDFSEDSRQDRLQVDMSEERRNKLREIELRCVQYQDEIEQGIRSVKMGYSINRQVQHYRNKLLRKIDRDELVEKRHHRRSVSPVEEKRSNKHSRSRRRSRSRSKSPAHRRRSRSPRKRRSRSRSSSRRHKKKSRH